ncbi:MAG: 23S rRNA (adenine(2503)-C(2))-methyltransferase RlmN, partial [Anaerolineales bacterium]
MVRPNIYDVSATELRNVLQGWGEPAYRARQLWNHLYQRNAGSLDEMTDLSKVLRQRLTETYSFGALEPVADLISTDGGTRKFLFRLADGRQIEAVLMIYRRRRTACISTQAGCAMGCVFCATGQMGFDRNLTAGEILEQVLWCARRLRERDDRLTNVVVMGMGEPFHNYDATMAAIDRLNDASGFNFGARRFTVSTVGLIPAIERFAAEKRQVNLAVSLHAATEDLRSALLPVNKRYPLRNLIPACRAYTETTGRRITFEWALIHDTNDSVTQARALAALVGGMPCHVNVIPLNP